MKARWLGACRASRSCQAPAELCDSERQALDLQGWAVSPAYTPCVLDGLIKPALSSYIRLRAEGLTHPHGGAPQSACDHNWKEHSHPSL